MNTIIETPFFFFHQKLEKLGSVTLSKKFTYITAALLPIISLVTSTFQLPYFYSISKWYTLLPLTALIYSILLLSAAINFYKGQNIFLISHLSLIYKESFKSFKNSKEYLLTLPSKKTITIYNTTPCKKKQEQKKDNVFVFSTTHETLIKETLHELKKEIINDDITIQDFKKVIGSCISKKTDNPNSFIKLELQSQHCAMFLEAFFIPFVELFTLHKTNLKESCRYFQYATLENYCTIKYDSISKKSRKLITNAHKETYAKILENVKSQLSKKLS
ncbi:hypothetical protein HX069_06210 [Myroides odoratimimus]|uniref:hypothetical protein n=1 Tax=Myroides odoratimimus TaxID=76832 RepID=UPI0025751CEB|nr:hypothetical protein [Myroides odoratimimus]MDM1678748.1 hypothetical protein [Myroides odoratimimus]